MENSSASGEVMDINDLGGEVEKEGEGGADDLMTTALPETMKEAADDTSDVILNNDANNDIRNEMNEDESGEKVEEAMHVQASVNNDDDAGNNIDDSYDHDNGDTTLESNSDYLMDDDTKIDTVVLPQQEQKVATNNNDPTKVSDESVDNADVFPTSNDNVQKEEVTVQNNDDDDEIMEDISTDVGNNIIENSAENDNNGIKERAEEEVEVEQIIILPNFNDDPIILPAGGKLSKQTKAEPLPEEDITIDDVNVEVNGDEGSGSTSNDDMDTDQEQTLTVDHPNSDESDIVHYSDDDNEKLAESTNQEDETDGQATNEKVEDTDSVDNSTVDNTKSSNDTTTTNNNDIEEEGEDGPRQIKLVDYASKLAGAQILEQSPSLKGASNLLTGDKDKYSIAPCDDKKYIIIGLSEDILVKQIKLSNYERYSSRVHEFQVLASQEYPTANDEYWNSIGVYEAHSKSGEQGFDLEEPAWARYLKFRFISHYGSEHYCTLSQIKVHGSTMLQGFHEQWIESEKLEEEEGSSNKDLEDMAQEEQLGEFDGQEVEMDDADEHEREEAKDDIEETQPVRGEGGDEQRSENNSAEMVDSTELGDRNDSVESDGVDDSLTEEESSDSQAEESPTATDANEIEDEMDQATQNEVGSEIIDDSDASTPDSTVQQENEKQERTGEVLVEVGASDETDASLSEGDDTNKQTLDVGEDDGEDMSAETEESHVEDIKSEDLNAEIMVEEPSSSHHEVHTSTVNDGNTSRVETKESITPEKDDEPPEVQDDSSIAAVTDVVKVAVADASDAIKNATFDAIKAIRTTVTGESDTDGLEVKLEEGNSSDAEEQENKNQATTNTKQDRGDTTSAKTSDNSTKQVQSKNETTTNDVKPKAEEGSEIVDTGDSASSDAKPEKRNPMKKETSKSTSASRDLLKREAISHAGKDDSIYASASELYAKLARRFPHASCIKDLDFQVFKSKTMLANADKSLGGTGSAPKMEPIFAKITSEIKSVQITQSQYEQYVSAVKTCHETIFLDMLKELDSTQSDVDQRLASLERAVFLSEMKIKGGRSRTSSSSDWLPRRFSNFPFAVSAFQFSVPVYAMPTLQENSKAVCASVATFLLVVRYLFLRRRKRTIAPITKHDSDNKDTDDALISDSSVSDSKNLRNNVSPPKQPAHIQDLGPTNDLLEENNKTKAQLADEKEKLRRLQEEHASLKQRYSELEQTVSSIENEVQHMTPRREIKHIIPNENGYHHGSAHLTPTPSVQSEPMQEIMRSSPAKSPLKNKFRKNKHTKNKHSR